MVGANVNPPPVPPLADIVQICDVLMAEGQFSVALGLLCARALYVSLAQFAKDLERYLEFPGLPPINRAHGLHELGGTLTSQERYSEAYAKYDKAGQIFDTTEYHVLFLILSIERCELDMKSGRRELQDIADTLWSIEDELQSFDHLEGVRKALSVLYEVAFRTRDHELRTKLDDEYRRNATVRGKLRDWLFQRQLMISQWTSISPITAHDVEALASMYEEVAGTEYNTLKINICRMLVDKYQSLGDNDRGSMWRDRLDGIETWVPEYMRFIVGLDEYYEGVQLANPTAEPGQELAEMQRQISRTLDQLTARGIPSANRWLGVLKISNLANFFMNNFSTRSLAQTSQLVQLCTDSREALSAELLPRQKAHLAAIFYQCDTRMHHINAHLEDDSTGSVVSRVCLDEEEMQLVLAGYEETEQLYGEAGSSADVACVQRMAAVAYHELWIVRGSPPDSSLFRSATTKIKAACRIFRSQASLELRRETAFQGARLWLQGFQANVDYMKPRWAWRWIGLGWVAHFFVHFGLRSYLAMPSWLSWTTEMLFRGPLDEAAAYLAEFETLVDRERQNLITLGDKQSILTKQRLSSRQQNVDAIALGVQIFHNKGGASQLWSWVQRSKARSLSDLLGLGAHKPVHVEEQIQRDTSLQKLLQIELELVQKLKEARGKQTSDQIFLWTKPEIHRASMRKHEPLRELLDLAVGATVSAKELFALPSEVDKTPRRTWSVDWIVVEEWICAIAVAQGSQTYFNRVMELKTAHKWAAKHLQAKADGLCLGDEDEGI